MSVNKHLLCIVATLVCVASATAQQRFDSAKAISNLAPTIAKLREIAKNTALSPEAAKSILLPGAESFEGLSTTYEVLGTKRLAKYTWYTIIVSTQQRWEQQTAMLRAIYKEMNRAFPGTFWEYPNAEWTIDSCLKVKTRARHNGREMAAILISFTREVGLSPQQSADSIRGVFYAALAQAGSSADLQAVAMRKFYLTLRDMALPKEVIAQAYHTAAKEKLAANPQLARMMLSVFPQLIPSDQIWSALPPQTAAAVNAQIRASNAADLAAQNARIAKEEAARKETTARAAAAASAIQYWPGSRKADGLGGPQSIIGTHVIRTLATSRSTPAKNHVITDRNIRIMSVQTDARNLKVGDQVLHEGQIKEVYLISESYAHLKDYKSLPFGRTVTAWRGVSFFTAGTQWDVCRACNGKAPQSGSAPVNVVTGYKTHTYNTGPQTVNVISTPTKTQVGSVGTTSYCSGCGGKGGKYVAQFAVEALD